MDRKVIYDFGANNGSNLPYYLGKCDLVVAVEANPTLAADIRSKFTSEVSSGRLIVENCVLSAQASSSSVPFYRHKTDDKLGRLLAPERACEYETIDIPSINAAELISRHGAPYYVKCDLESYDAEVLRTLFIGGIRPPFISAESLSIDVFCTMVSLGGYRSFSIVDGPTVQKKYGFPFHSAGPFGHDIAEKWMTPDNFFRYLALVGLGWKDIHATTEIDPETRTRARTGTYVFATLNDIRKKVLGIYPD